MATIQEATAELHRIYDLFNKHFFEGKLPTVAITIQSAGKKPFLGWCSVEKIWKGDGVEYYELNMSGEYLDRPYMEILQTLLHEMLHVYANVNEIKDTSRGFRYHNKRFKANAEQFGMVYPHAKPDPKIGYSAVELTEETKKLIEEKFKVNEKAFAIARVRTVAGSGAGKKSFKLECPSCGMILRATKSGFKVICRDCEIELVEE